MTKGRLEAFSDGVFAIVITLLILDVKIPSVRYDQLPGALIDVLPKIFTYVLSFIIVGVHWVSHHSMLSFLKHINRRVLWINLVTLLCIGFIPFPTSLLGEFPLQRLPVIIYGVILMLTSMSGRWMWRYISREQMSHPYLPRNLVKQLNRVFTYSNFVYLLAIALSFVSVFISYFIYLGVTVYIMFRQLRPEKEISAMQTNSVDG